MAASLTLSDLGEDAVVRALTALLPEAVQSVPLGPGDDCAAVAIAGSDEVELLKADSVVEGVHFLAGEDMRRVGWKALCRAISDIAAMGGLPLHALVTIAAAPSMQMLDLLAFYEGITKAAASHGISIVGGETGKTTGPLVCSIFLTGKVRASECVTRGGGRPGDVLFVTGLFGGSLASGRHLDFKPRLEEGRWLATHHFRSAMMDVSDGLAADLPRLALASKCGVSLAPERLPRHAGCSVEEALCEGEDFELLLAVPAQKVEGLKRDWRRAFPLVCLTDIGSLTEADKGCTPSGIFTKGGYDHFQ
ncbi:MAG: thiamine-monophosphate kinase [Verrucomicrobia bacterium]|nr:MAG: thiamine-monophosphate kinase [Verrucomicrobiota bacterium]